jgi:hypothetical protein
MERERHVRKKEREAYEKDGERGIWERWIGRHMGKMERERERWK